MPQETPLHSRKPHIMNKIASLVAAGLLMFNVAKGKDKKSSVISGKRVDIENAVGSKGHDIVGSGSENITVMDNSVERSGVDPKLLKELRKKAKELVHQDEILYESYSDFLSKTTQNGDSLEKITDKLSSSSKNLFKRYFRSIINLFDEMVKNDVPLEKVTEKLDDSAKSLLESYFDLYQQYYFDPNEDNRNLLESMGDQINSDWWGGTIDPNRADHIRDSMTAQGNTDSAAIKQAVDSERTNKYTMNKNLLLRYAILAEEQEGDEFRVFPYYIREELRKIRLKIGKYPSTDSYVESILNRGFLQLKLEKDHKTYHELQKYKGEKGEKYSEIRTQQLKPQVAMRQFRKMLSKTQLYFGKQGGIRELGEFMLKNNIPFTEISFSGDCVYGFFDLIKLYNAKVLEYNEMKNDDEKQAKRLWEQNLLDDAFRYAYIAYYLKEYMEKNSQRYTLGKK